MSQPDDRHRALLRVLVRHDVRFVLVGGVALQLRGFSGATLDVDVVIASDERNHRRVDAALESLRARPHLPGQLGSAFRTELGQVELLRSSSGVGDYDAWTRHATPIEIEPGITVQVGGASDLLLAKEQAARQKDLEALPRIRAELLASGALDAADIRGPVAEPAHELAPDPRVEQLLGPRPGERRARGLWDHGAVLVLDYRERWKVPEDAPLLGEPPTTGTDQEADRDALDRQLLRLQRLIGRTE